MRTWPWPPQVPQVVGRRARLGAAAVAGVALVPARHADGRVEAVRSLLQCNFQVVAQVGATVHLWPRIAAASSATAKDVAEDIAEAVGKAASTAAEAATARPCSGPRRRDHSGH